MAEVRTWTGRGAAAGAAVLAGVMAVATPAGAQEELPAVNEGNISLEAGVEFVTEYWFRGLAQQNKGVIAQPFATVGVLLPSLGDVDVEGYVGTWSSLHDRDTDGAAMMGVSDSNWYQHDLTVGLTFGLPGDVSVDAAYVNRYQPATGSSLVEELQIGVRYDDAPLMEEFNLDFSLQPRLLLAVETHGGLDMGTSRGTYFELGVSPSFLVLDDEDYPVTLTVPATLGLNFGDYYESPQGEDKSFGYFQIGAVASAPLPFIPQEYGEWNVNAGVHLLWLGRSARQISSARGMGGDSFNMFGSVGVGMSY